MLQYSANILTSGAMANAHTNTIPVMIFSGKSPHDTGYDASVPILTKRRKTSTNDSRNEDRKTEERVNSG